MVGILQCATDTIVLYLYHHLLRIEAPLYYIYIFISYKIPNWSLNLVCQFFIFSMPCICTFVCVCYMHVYTFVCLCMHEILYYMEYDISYYFASKTYPSSPFIVLFPWSEIHIYIYLYICVWSRIHSFPHSLYPNISLSNVRVSTYILI